MSRCSGFTLCEQLRLHVLSHQCYGLTAKEVENAKRYLCRIVQREVYATEFQSVENDHEIARDSTLLQHSPYIDEEDIF